jgi:hypothetical protein
MQINKHLFRDEILTTTLRKVIDEINPGDVIDQGNTVCLRFDNVDGLAYDDEIHFYIQGALAVSIENTIEGRKQREVTK